MTAKISPSLDPWSHLASVRSGGWVPSGACGPFPLASSPWQNLQYFWNTLLPFSTDCGVNATGFVAGALAALAAGLADCASPGLVDAIPTQQTMRAAVAGVRIRRIVLAVPPCWLTTSDSITF